MLRNFYRLPFSTLCLMLLHFHYTNGDMKVICDRLEVGVYPTEKCTHLMGQRLKLLNNKVSLDEQFSFFKDDTDNKRNKILPFINFQSGEDSEVYENVAALARNQGFQGVMVSLPHNDLKEAYENISKPIFRLGLELYISIGIYYVGLDRDIEPDIKSLGEIIKNKKDVNLVVEILPNMEQFEDLMKNKSQINTQRSYLEKRINYLTNQGFPASNLIIMVAPYVFEYSTRLPITCAYKHDMEEFCKFNFGNKKLTSTNEVREIRCGGGICSLKESSFLHREKIELLAGKNIGSFYFTGFPTRFHFYELNDNQRKVCFEELNVLIRSYIDAVPQSSK